MNRWFLSTIAAAIVGGAAAVAAASVPTLIDFENATPGDVSLVYTTDWRGPVPVWAFSATQQVPAYVTTVKRDNVLGLRSADDCRRIHVGVGTACHEGAANNLSFELVGTTAPVYVVLFDRGGNVGPTIDGVQFPATGATGSRTITFGPGTTGLAGDAIAEFAVVFKNGDGTIDDIAFTCGEEPPPPPPPPPTNDCDDWFTGGGWIIGPSGTKCTFGVGGGFKKNGLWGHLNYIDHTKGMHVHWQTITAYSDLGGTRRRVEGTCTIDGAAGTFVLEVEDNGEPGRADKLDLRLSNGYSASGTLDGGGNIQLHKANCNTGGKGGGKTRKRRVR